jgi:hypothetical protein
VIGTFAFVQVENPDPADELVVDGRGNRDSSARPAPP